MNKAQIAKRAQALVNKAGSRDPFDIARMLGIEVKFCEDFGSLKGACQKPRPAGVHAL